MPDFEKIVGRILAKQRQRAGHTQESLAEICELHPTYISQLERGLKNPTLRVFFRLSNAMGISPSALAKKIEKETNKTLPE